MQEGMKHIFLIFQIVTLIISGIIVFYFYQQYKSGKDFLNRIFLIYIISNSIFSVIEFLENYGIINLEYIFYTDFVNTVINALYYTLWTVVLYVFVLFLFNPADKKARLKIGIIFIITAGVYYLLYISKLIDYMINAGRFHICPPIGTVLTPVLLIIFLLIYFLFINRSVKHAETKKTFRTILILFLSGYGLFFISSIYNPLRTIFPIVSVFYLNISAFVWYSRYYVKNLPSVSSIPEHDLIPVFRDNYNLSNRELDVLAMLLQGKKNKEIEEALFISPNTIRNHISALYKKMGNNSRGQLMNLVIKLQKGE